MEPVKNCIVCNAEYRHSGDHCGKHSDEELETFAQAHEERVRAHFEQSDGIPAQSKQEELRAEFDAWLAERAKGQSTVPIVDGDKKAEPEESPGA